jgi:hypothetical protein
VHNQRPWRDWPDFVGDKSPEQYDYLACLA